MTHFWLGNQWFSLKTNEKSLIVQTKVGHWFKFSENFTDSDLESIIIQIQKVVGKIIFSWKIHLFSRHTLLIWISQNLLITNELSKSESVKFSLIESVTFFSLIHQSKTFFTVKSVNFNWFISEKKNFTVKSVNFHWNNQWNLTDIQ